MVIDDQVTTIAFSSEIHNEENFQSDYTLSDKVNDQYVCLTNKILYQIEQWHNISEKVDNYYKSAEDLKEDFIQLKERIERLEAKDLNIRNRWNTMKVFTITIRSLSFSV